MMVVAKSFPLMSSTSYETCNETKILLSSVLVVEASYILSTRVYNKYHMIGNIHNNNSLFKIRALNVIFDLKKVKGSQFDP